MRNDAKPIIPPRQEDSPPAPGAPPRERGGPPATPAAGGRLRDRSLERSARSGGGTDAELLDLDSGRRSLNVSVLMSALAVMVLVLFLIIFFSWPEGPITPQDASQQDASQQAATQQATTQPE